MLILIEMVERWKKIGSCILAGADFKNRKIQHESFKQRIFKTCLKVYFIIQTLLSIFIPTDFYFSRRFLWQHFCPWELKLKKFCAIIPRSQCHSIIDAMWAIFSLPATSRPILSSPGFIKTIVQTRMSPESILCSPSRRSSSNNSSNRSLICNLWRSGTHSWVESHEIPLRMRRTWTVWILLKTHCTYWARTCFPCYRNSELCCYRRTTFK